MSLTDPTKKLAARAADRDGVMTTNVWWDAPGPRKIAAGCTTVLERVVKDLEHHLKDESYVQCVAMTPDCAEVVVDDSRGIFGSRTLKWMAQREEDGDEDEEEDEDGDGGVDGDRSGERDRAFLDEYYKDRDKFDQAKNEARPELHPNPNANYVPAYIATYNVSPTAPGPRTRTSEPEGRGPWNDALLKGFIEELKRLQGNGVVVSATYNGWTAVIVVDAPGGL